jgi:hypothetical protein
MIAINNFYIGQHNNGDQALKFSSREEFLETLNKIIDEAEDDHKKWFEITIHDCNERWGDG